MELNNTYKLKPKSTGEGRFGNWLENLVDWNLSRSRFWGIQFLFGTDDGEEEICISSVQMLKEEVKNLYYRIYEFNPLENFEVGNFRKKIIIPLIYTVDLMLMILF